MKVTYNVKFTKRSQYWEEHEVISQIVRENYENAQIEYSTAKKARASAHALDAYVKKNKINVTIHLRKANVIISRS